MAHSFASLTFHIVFSTKDRRPLITPDLQPRLYDYIGGIIRGQGGVLLAAGGMANHGHLLAGTARDKCMSDFVRAIKGNSSRWVHEEFPHLRHFGWQEGYGAFSISYPGQEKVKAYIAGQAEHHRTVTFQEEFIAFLKQHQISYDERYIWE